MNYLGDGQLIARIDGTKKKLYISENEADGKSEIILSGSQKFQPTFDPETERQIWAIFGASGSGKSYFARSICREYNELYKKQNVFLFSPVNEDKSLEGIKNLCKIDISNPEFLSETITLEDLENSCVVFDDCESISDKMINKKIRILSEMLMERGRHHNISVLFLNHTPCNASQTKKVLQESHSITIFLRKIGGRNLLYLLQNYLGLDKEQIKLVKTMKADGRALTFVKSYPMVAITEKRAITLEAN